VSGASDPATATGRPARAEEIVLVALVVLSIAGIAVIDFSARYGLWYWLAMVPVFGGASIASGWSRARGSRSLSRVLRAQLLHWVGLLLAVYLVYLLQATGRLNSEDAGVVALLALSLTTFLAGVHFDWRFCVLGAVLGLAVACAALIHDFFWILLVVVVLAGAGLLVWRRRAAA
jgi:hypothetical protein